MIGDGHVLPAANQLSESATQKSGSECVIMACVSVITMLSAILNVRPEFDKCWVRSSMVDLSDCDVGVSVLGTSSPKVMSVNVGADVNSVAGISTGMSKSEGNGNSFVVKSFVVSSITGAGVRGVLNIDVCI